MIATKTNLEITEYREKFFLGLSLRQLACLAGRGAVSGYWLLSSTGRFAGHRWQHHGASVGNAGAVGDPAGGSVYERKVHESHYQCNDLIPFGD